MIPHTRRFAPLLLATALLASACSGESGGGQAAIGGPFHLVDQHGQARDEGILKGKWSAVYFGYTFCPDVCPTTLQTLAETQALLGGAAKDLQVVFITVDPERDGPAQMNSYLSNSAFPKGTIGLTGTPAQIAGVAKAWKLFYQKQGSGSGYEVQHTSAIYLMDPKGRFKTVLSADLPPKDEARQISQAMAEG